MLSLLMALGAAAALCACATRTEDDVTRVQVGAAKANAPRIDPRVFSNFLEHLGGTIYEGLWANTVYNPQFEANREGQLDRWSLHNGAEWIEGGVAGRCVRLQEGGAVSQTVSLPLHRQRCYVGTVWMLPLANQPVELVAAIHRAGESPRTDSLAHGESRAAEAQWQPCRFTFVVPEKSFQRGETCRLSLTITKGAACVDMAEVFPIDHLDGVDPDVFRAAKALHIALLRWPGGNFVSGYRWRDGIGPREKRPTVPNPAWPGLETHHFGTDEFLRFCKRLGAQPHLCVNAGDGTPEEAAAWVEYCNGSRETPMGRLRAENGHPEPYGVRVWEIGNELYGDWQIGHTDPAGNADRFARFDRAMRAADPTIEIIATGKGDEFTGAGLARVNLWNETLLDAAWHQVPHPPEYVSLHPLVPLPGDLHGTFAYDDIYLSAMAHPQWWQEIYIPMLRRQIQARFGERAKTRAAVTEWGIIVGGSGWRETPNHDAQSGAVYAALFFHAMFRRADFVTLSNVTALMHGGGIKRPNSVVFTDPMYHVERMYGAARPARLLPVTMTGPAYDVPERGFLPAVQHVPYLDVIAVEGKSGRYLFVVNRDPHRARRAEFTLPSAPKAATIETLTADPQARNSLEHPNAVAPTTATLSLSDRAFVHRFPPCSVSRITW